MRINFEKVKVKNFQSYGNSEIVLDYTKEPFTLIVGSNGVGKSTLIIDAICYALYGKVIRRGVTLATIINNTNKKNCLIELEFNIDNKKKYKIRRGLKPDVLELYIDNEIQEQESSKKLIQSQIEEIIKIDIATLTNICIMTIDNRKPFVDLTPEETRNITENLFGVSVFSTMIKNFKEQNKEIKDKLKVNDKDLILYKELAKEGVNKLKEYKNLKENFEEERTKKIEGLNKYKDQLNTEKEEYEKKLLTLEKESSIKIKDKEIFEKELESSKKEINKKDYDKEIKTIEKAINDYKNEKTEHDSNIKTSKNLIAVEEKKLKTIQEGDSCPTCNEIFTKEKKNKEIKNIEKLINNHNKSIKSNQNAIGKLVFKIADEEQKIDNLKKEKSELEKKINESERKLNTLNNEINNFDNNIKNLNNNISNANNNISNIENNIQEVLNENIEDKVSKLIDKKKIEEHKNKYLKLKEENVQLIDESKYISLILTLLPDIKNDIIQKDIPKLNSLIVDYMKEFQKSFAIQFDREFKVSIHGHSKKGLGYYNLSSGEKKRLDIVILLSFIDLIKSKNSISTNLLCFDEIMTTSLDEEGKEILVDILNRKIKEGYIDNIFIVTHDKNITIPNSRTMEIYKENGFSKLKYESN